MIDWHDSEGLNVLADKNIELAMAYSEARNDFADAKYALDIILSNAYATKEIDSKVAYEKALLLLMPGEKKKEVEQYYRVLLASESRYKGLERVIEANKDKLVLAMSLQKNQAKETK